MLNKNEVSKFSKELEGVALALAELEKFFMEEIVASIEEMKPEDMDALSLGLVLNEIDDQLPSFPIGSPLRKRLLRQKRKLKKSL